jgi:hypothetical protein
VLDERADDMAFFAQRIEKTASTGWRTFIDSRASSA